jgi:hypothetical protein
MSNITNTKLNLFASSFQSIPAETITLAQALDAIRLGHHKAQVQTVRQILAREGKRAYDRAKVYLPAVTFGGTFLPTRGNAHLQQHSGILHGDLDHLRDVAAVKQAICADPRTAYAFISPSGEGLKLGVHIEVIADDAAYKHAWATISDIYEQCYGGTWDPSGKDVSRLCFMSYDPKLYTNFHATCFEVPPPLTPQPPLPPPPLHGSLRLDDHQDYATRALRTAVQMIQSAPMGMRHHTRLKAARLLGGYVGGGLLPEEQAYGALAQALVGHTEDLERALKTVEDGLTYGQAHPITLEALEAERHAWIETHRPIPPQPRKPPDHHDPWEGTRTLPLRPYQGLPLGKAVRRV